MHVSFQNNGNSPCALLLKRVANLPVMSERIDNTSEPPSVVVSDRHYLFRTRGYGSSKDGVRIRNDQDHPGGTAIEGLGAEVMMLWRFIRQPELCPVDRKRCYDRTG